MIECLQGPEELPEVRRGMIITSRLPPLLVASALLAGAVACGGGGASPTSANASTPAALTIAAVAPSLALEINLSLTSALKAGLGIASLQAPNTFMASLLELWPVTRVHAQTGFIANCRSGGTVGLSTAFSTPGGGRVVFSNTPINYSNCGFPFNGRTVTLNGTLTGQGTWTAAEPNNPVSLAGSLDVNEIGPVQVVCSSLSAAAGCNGSVGGIRTGPADTPPPPNPTPTPTPTPSPCSQFDGNYTGTYSGSLTSMGESRAVSGGVALAVGSCAITVSAPGSGTGSLSAAGSATFGGTLSVPGQSGTLSCSFSGTFGSNAASGGWTCSGEASGSGTWSVGRN